MLARGREGDWGRSAGAGPQLFRSAAPAPLLPAVALLPEVVLLPAVTPRCHATTHAVAPQPHMRARTRARPSSTRLLSVRSDSPTSVEMSVRHIQRLPRWTAAMGAGPAGPARGPCSGSPAAVADDQPQAPSRTRLTRGGAWQHVRSSHSTASGRVFDY